MKLKITFCILLLVISNFARGEGIRSCGFRASQVVDYKGNAYFCGTHEELGRELFRSNGEHDGTYIVKDIDAGIASSNPVNLFVFNDKLFFLAETGDIGWALWESDGADITLVKRLADHAVNESQFQVAVGTNVVYILLKNKDFSRALWKTDGTSQGTDLVEQGRHLNASHLKNGLVGDRLFYFSDTQTLKVVNGFSGSSTTLHRFPFRGYNDRPRVIGPLGNGIGIHAFSDNYNSDYWFSDGSVANTELVLSGADGYIIVANRYMEGAWLVCRSGTNEYFTVNGATIARLKGIDHICSNQFDFVGTGQGVYVTLGLESGAIFSDGTVEGTSNTDLEIRLASDSVLFADGYSYFLTLPEPSEGREIWRTKGTESTTERVAVNAQPRFNPLGW